MVPHCKGNGGSTAVLQFPRVYTKEDAGISLCLFDTGLLAQSRPQITRDLDLQKPHVPRKQIITALRLSNSNSNSNSNIAYFVNSHILHTYIYYQMG